MTLLATGAAHAATPLSRYIGSARVLVVSAPNVGHSDVGIQIAAVGQAAAGMRDRDLVVVRVEGGTATDDRGAALDASAVRAALSLPADRFEAVLVGKDGGAKLRRSHAIPTDELFGTIDAMPMRRVEMRGK